jgi:predicted nucleotidyltransferase
MLKIEQNKLKELCEGFSLSFIALFGSQVRGKRSFKGDFDLAVLTQKPLHEDKELELICRFSQILESNKVDVVILNFASPLLQYEVAKGAVLLFENIPGSFNEFKNLAVRKWNDNKKFNELRIKYIKDFTDERHYA